VRNNRQPSCATQQWNTCARCARMAVIGSAQHSWLHALNPGHRVVHDSTQATHTANTTLRGCAPVSMHERMLADHGTGGAQANDTTAVSTSTETTTNRAHHATYRHTSNRCNNLCSESRGRTREHGGSWEPSATEKGSGRVTKCALAAPQPNHQAACFDVTYLPFCNPRLRTSPL